MAMELSESGILDELNVELLGTKLSAIDQAEDRDLFKQLMEELEQPIPEVKLSIRWNKPWLLPNELAIQLSFVPHLL